ncbi:MAG: AmmeMemoRadiSam system protein B [Nitrospinota bacterium]|nr:AmmeMemoRadiSam system protein B [Nitrospinota bacterium]
MPITAKRRTAVAGSFYPGTEKEMSKEVNRLLGDSRVEREVAGCISPHAGWMYSGEVAGALFGSIKIPDSIILIGPNHRGLGERVAIDSANAWEFPFGDVPVDRELAKKIASDCEHVRFDSAAHMMEHSLEVLVPFLYYRNKNIRIVPVSLGTQRAQTLKMLGSAIGKRASESGSLVISSSDLSHFLTDSEARERDRRTIEQIVEFTEESIIDILKSDNALCGVSSVSTLLWAAGEMGATKAELVEYANSGDITGDLDRVVGYASFIIS